MFGGHGFGQSRFGEGASLFPLTIAVPVAVATWVVNAAVVSTAVLIPVPVAAATWTVPPVTVVRHVAVTIDPIQPVPYVELELAGPGNGWTDVTLDVESDPGLTIQHGIQGSGPADRVAGTGVAKFVLDNAAETNTAGLLGYYSPYHANKRAGWKTGIGCRIRFQDPNTSVIYTRFVGRIDAIDPLPGVDGNRSVAVTATDWMDEAARWTLTPNIGQQVGKRWDEILAAILGQMPRQPVATTFDFGVESYPYALDTSVNSKQPALGEFVKLAASEFGLIYQKADGTLRGEGRHARLLDTIDDWTLPDTELQDLHLPSTRDEIINTVRVTIHQKRVDAAPTTRLYDQTSVISIPPGSTKFLLGPYRDPVTGDPIGGTDIQLQVAGTDYLANTAEAGAGTDITSDLVIVVTDGASGASFSVTNHNAATAYLTRNRLYGKGIYDRGTLQLEATDDPSIDENGEHAVNFDMPYQDDDDVGQGAANYTLAKYSSAFAQARTIRVLADSAAALTQVLSRDISDRLAISETVTGLSSSYFINGELLTLTPGGHVEAIYTLAPAADPFAGLYWILGTSVLGTGTLPAPF